jgi:hypothetical protein
MKPWEEQPTIAKFQVLQITRPKTIRLRQNKNIVDKIGDYNKAGFSRVKSVPALEEKEMYGIPPKARNEQYDMMEIINRLVDNSEFEAYKDGYGQTIITGYARIEMGSRNCCQSKKSGKTKKGRNAVWRSNLFR